MASHCWTRSCDNNCSISECMDYSKWQFEQQKIEYLLKILRQVIFNLIANVEKLKYCTLFGSQGESNKYLKPDALIELTTISQAESTSLEQCRLQWISWLPNKITLRYNPDELLKFRFLSKENKGFWKHRSPNNKQIISYLHKVQIPRVKTSSFEFVLENGINILVWSHA